MPDITLRRFDPSIIESNAVCMFVGRRGTGKTTLVQDILYYLRWIPDGVVFSATEDCNGTWGKHFPGSFIYDGYKPEAMASIILRQRIENGKHKKHPDLYPLRQTAMVCEDIMYDKIFTRDKNTRGVMMNGRHWGILLLLTIQYMMDLTRDLRDSVDYLFVLKDNNIGNLERLYRNWFGAVIPTFDAFCAIMKHFTKDRGCLVLNNKSTSDQLEDCVFWYKATIRPSYRFGGKAYWMYHHLNKKSDEEIEKEAQQELYNTIMTNAGVKKKEKGSKANSYKIQGQI